MGGKDDADALVRECTRELSEIERPMEFVFRPQTVIFFVGILQLADRHPSLSETSRETIRIFVDGAREYFANCPAILELIRRGDDRAWDSHE